MKGNIMPLSYVLYMVIDRVDNKTHKKAQLTQGWHATAVRVWRPLGNKSEPSQKPNLEPNIMLYMGGDMLV